MQKLSIHQAPFFQDFQRAASDRLGPISVGGLGGGRAHMVSNNSKRTKVLLDSAYEMSWWGSQVDMASLGPKSTGNGDYIYIYMIYIYICLNYGGSHTILLYHTIRMIHRVYLLLNIFTVDVLDK